MDITPRLCSRGALQYAAARPTIWAMRTTISSASPSRNKGFSLLEVAAAIALLSIATAFSLPRVNRLASRTPIVAPDAPHNAAPCAYPQHPTPGAGYRPGAVKFKLIDLIHGYPANGAGRVPSDWGGFATTDEPDFHALTSTDAPSGENCSASGYAPQFTKSAAAGANLNTNGR
jgi:prepilin-type N-terminal cleavage/methylation domain-containing protein